MFQDRWYQDECVEALYKDVIESKSVHPIGVVPTGGGKTIILCKLIDKILSERPTSNILVLAADKRILGQNKKSLEGYFEGIEIGLCSAGLKSYDVKKITVAGIQSVYRKADDFAYFDYIIIDECHLINPKQKGMYRTFLDQLDANYIGLTATHFRTGHGYIHEGKDALFNKISYDMSAPEVYNRIVAEGYLSQLFSYPTALKLTGDGCRTTAGDWNEKDLSEINDRDHITEGAIIESIHYGKKYHHWLFFSIDIKHCDNIVEKLNSHGISAVAIHSKAEGVDQKIEDFKSGKYRAAVQVNMLTTGFDYPEIDLICDMRPTKSPILHVQGKGRGGRVVYASGYDLDTIEGRLAAIENGPKPHCLVLDFAGNIERLGPINYVTVKKQKDKKGKGQPITKNCPECRFINWGGAKLCENCGFEFVFEEKLKMQASSAEIIKKDFEKKPVDKKPLKEWLDVTTVKYSRHPAKNPLKPDTMRVSYQCGMRSFSEYIAIDHSGYARHNARNWVKFRWPQRTDIAPPNTLTGLLFHSRELLQPKKIEVDDSGKYAKIVDVVF